MSKVAPASDATSVAKGDTIALAPPTVIVQPLMKGVRVARFLGAERSCAVCGARWWPYLPHADAKEVDELCGFEVARALNLLCELSHRCHDDPRQHEAARAAEIRLVQYQRMLAPERVSERELVSAVDALASPLRRFVEARERLESPREPEADATLAEAVRLAGALGDCLRDLCERWAFDTEGRSLPGTRRPGRREERRLLGELESMLVEGGFTQPAIGDLDLDGQLANDALPTRRERARKRVVARLSEERERLERLADDPLLLALDSFGAPPE